MSLNYSRWLRPELSEMTINYDTTSIRLKIYVQYDTKLLSNNSLIYLENDINLLSII